MRRALLTLLAAIAVLAVLVPVSTSLAADADPDAGDVGFPYYGGLGGGKPLLSCTGFFQMDGQAVVSEDALGGLTPCRSVCDILVTANRIIIMLFSVLVTIVAPILVFVGGFLIFTGGGSPAQRGRGMKMITGTGIGLLMVVCSFLIVNQLLGLVFQQSYGEALTERLKEQIADKTITGITAEEAENLFDWNNISCTVLGSSVAVEPAPPAAARGTCASGSTRGYCGTNAAQGTYDCATGWKVGMCPTADVPLCCIPPAPGHACFAACEANGKTWLGMLNKNGGQCVCQ